MEDYNGDVQAESPGPTLLLNGEVLETHQVEELIGCSCEDLEEEQLEDLVEGVEELEVEDEEDEEGVSDEEEEVEEAEPPKSQTKIRVVEEEEEEEDEDDEEEENDDEEEEELVTEKQEGVELVKEDAQEEGGKEVVVAPEEEEEEHKENLIEEKPRRKQDSPKLGVRERIEEVKRKTEIEEQKREKELENQRQKAGTNNNMSDKKSRFGGNIEKCTQCNRTVYAMEKLEVAGRIMHKTCFRCCKCNSQLSVGRFSVGGDDLYCMTHYKQAFREKGTYDVFTPNNPCKGKWETKAQQ